MTTAKLKELQEKGLVSEDQFNKIEPIISGKILSVFYELRTLLYLGVMLFTTGIGFLIYQNIGQLGHILAIIALSVLSILCFAYCFIKGKSFSPAKVDSPNPYYDYVLLLGCLLFVSVFGYLQFQFGFLEQYARISALLTAILFFFLAYRFDHLGVLSLAITAFVSFFGIVVSLEGLDSFDHLQNVGLILSLTMGGLATLIEKRGIKAHFTFTYLNFCLLIFFCSTFSGIFGEHDSTYLLYFVALFVGVLLSIYLSNWKKSFMFLLYGVVAGYIGLTYWLGDNADWGIEGWLFYLIISCGGFIYFIVRFRTYFKRKE